MKYKWKYLKFEKAFLGILLAVEVILSFTFLGEIRIPPISETTAYIPVVVAACLFGPGESVAAGLLFGLISIYKASAGYAMPADMIFSPFQSDDPIGSILLSVGTSVLFGFLIGFLFSLVKKAKNKWLWEGILAFGASKLYTALVYGAMKIFFPEYGLGTGTLRQLEKSDMVVTLICIIFVLLSDWIYHSRRVIHYRNAVNESENNPYWSSKSNIALAVGEVFVVFLSILSAIYFSDRMKYMLGVYGIEVTENVRQDIFHLQIQFLISMLALNFILLLIIQLVYRYMKYREYEGNLDYLTGAMGRKLFLHYCEEIQKNRAGEKGWFLFVDVDYFKQINDSVGHSTGDIVLKGIVQNLQEIFDAYGAVGRVGGDEFVVFIDQKMTAEQLKGKLEEFLKKISDIRKDQKISCSIGAYQFTFPQEMKTLFTRTDRILYKVKENGRAGFLIEEEE